MATLQSLSSTGPPIGHGKITKSRSRQAVKPILKKLQSHSEKNSLDLDRGWEDQAQYGYSSYKTGGDDISAAGGTYSSSFIPTSSHAPRSARDVSFSISATELGTGAPRSNKYNHARSTSGTSHASVATTTSGSRTGVFVHPFQQMPRTSTPPLSYATSLASLDNPTGPRDYSPTITEDDDDIEAQFWGTRNYPLPLSHPHPRPRRPSLASQRTSSLSDINQTLRATTNSRTSSGVATRIAPRIVTKSRSDLHLNTASSTALDSASSTSPPTGSFISPQMMAASSSSAAMSPLRSSMEANGFRLRSRSEADTSDRRDAVREARRKFDEKEKAKEEKYAREKIRKQERADHKEASRVNKSSHGRKSSFGHSRISCDRASSVTDFRPSFSRKNTGTALDEKLDFASRGYDTVPSGQTPHARADRVNFTSTKRNGTTKRKTSGTWTAFVLWLRTRLLRLGRQ